MVVVHDSPLAEFRVAIGEVTIEWNRMHWGLLGLFQEFMPCPRELSEALFFSAKTDREQRALVRSAAEAIPHLGPCIHAIREVIKRIDDEAGLRNAAIHSWWSYDRANNVKVRQKNRLSGKGDGEAMKKELDDMALRYDAITIWLGDLILYLDKNIDMNPIGDRQKPI